MIAPVEQEGLELLLTEEFGSAPPAHRSTIIGYFDDEKPDGLEGLIVCENLLYIGMPWVRPDARSKGIPEKLIQYLEMKCEQEQAAAISIASEERFEKLLTRHGMWKVEGSLYRRNFNDGD